MYIPEIKGLNLPIAEGTRQTRTIKAVCIMKNVISVWDVYVVIIKNKINMKHVHEKIIYYFAGNILL